MDTEVTSGQSGSRPSEVRTSRAILIEGGVWVARRTSEVLIGCNPLEMKRLEGFGQAPDLPTYRRRNKLMVHSPGYVAELLYVSSTHMTH